ncbi:hypothetical protein HWV62_35230 [Athelia sp. TMB]|nr:hypothetical protein HWV62_35230 [Athelia sp. TMB]
MTEQAETVFVRGFLNSLSNQPITYGDDYQQPLQNSLKRVPVLPAQIGLPPPPSRKRQNVENTPLIKAAGQSDKADTHTAAAITITFKSLKPPKSFSLEVQPTDTIQSIKSQLASLTGAPPADIQRLLLKGKALADNKLLKEYAIKDGDTVNLAIRPGQTWDPNAMSAPAPTQLRSTPSHSRIPSVVLSPSPSISATTPSQEVDKPLDINLTLDTSQVLPSAEATSTYHATLADPGFWERLNAFVKTEFKTESDALLAFEDFLRASKGTLTASEIAKIRDQVGVVGMAGT